MPAARAGLAPASSRRPAAARPIGSHTPVAGGMARRGLRYVAAVEATAIQVFVANPRGWAPVRRDRAQEAELRAHAERAGLPVFVHAPYLINVAAPDPRVAELSVRALTESLDRGRDLGATGVVVHTGSAVTGGREQGLRRVRERLLPVLDALPGDGPDLLLEPTAAQGQLLCGPVTELEPYLDALDWHPRANVCLDTCHVFAAGHDLTAPGGAADLLSALQRATRDPGGRLRLIHANDSRAACGSHRDLHENIGRGQLGRAPFAALLAHPLTAGVPVIVETPGDEAGHAADIATLRALEAAGMA
jgi:deoxyribonuclease-4